MKNETDEINTAKSEQARGEPMNQTPKFDMIAKGVASGVAVSTIIQVGRGAIRTLTKNPLFMFSLGLATGYFTHKYRKEIIRATHKTVEQSKDFIVRQKECLIGTLTESREGAEEEDASK
ncbi:MAG: hypothetical protein Q7U57_09075 [Methylovulum sp.]|nr:hypothetical protein [Methylovulum sp.]